MPFGHEISEDEESRLKRRRGSPKELWSQEAEQKRGRNSSQPCSNERVSSHPDNCPLLKINPISRSSAPPSTGVQDSSGAM